jgi:ATP-binding cassette subfamily F protein 1
MVRKKEDAGAVAGGGKAKAGGGGGGNVKKEKLSVSAFLSSLDKKEEKPVKPKPAVGGKTVKKAPAAATSAYGDIDLPPEDEEDEGMDSEEEAALALKRGERRGLDLTVKDKDVKKKDKKEMMAAQAAEFAKHEAMKDDKDAFSVTIGAKTAALEGEETAAEASMKDIKIENFSVSARGKELLKNTSITVVHGRRYGLVGPNGTGKSTLLKLLAWRQIPVPKNIDVLLVEQEVVGDEKTALESVVSADAELVRLREEAARLQSLSEAKDGEGDGDEADDTGEQLTAVFEQLQVLGTDAAEARASKILAGLGFSVAMQGRATKSFSGGWRMRISLARALFMQPTLLLLDEPTNHLDLRAVMWLEQYLERWKKTLIVVSHDREFLNTVSTDIIHLHDHKLLTYKGNFAAFEEMYEQKRRENNKKYEVYEKQLKAAKRSGSKAQQDKVKDRAKFAAGKDAKSKGKSKAVVDDEETAPEAPKRWRDYQVEFHFPEPTELTPPLLQLIDVGFGYPGRPDFALKGIDVGVDMGTRVAIVGPNGAGKSTLLNLLAGDLQPTEGESRQSQKLRVGRYSQHFVDSLQMDETPVQYLLRLYPDQEGPSKQETVRAKLGKFGLPSHNHLTPIVKLSGGQKARVVFTSISMARPHILLLDEPTNHLDMQSIDALADALDEFSGGVLLVSHDARLISRVCEEEENSVVWVVEDGSVRKYPGSFDDYKKELTEEIRAEVED